MGLERNRIGKKRKFCKCIYTKMNATGELAQTIINYCVDDYYGVIKSRERVCRAAATVRASQTCSHDNIPGGGNVVAMRPIRIPSRFSSIL
jgi:hypothetical protein